MKKLMLFMIVGMFMITACEESVVAPSIDDPTSLSKANGNGSASGTYLVTSTWDGFTLTIDVNQSAAKASSHMLVQLIDCEGNYVDHIVSSSIPADFTTGKGTGCAFDSGNFIKFDNLDVFASQSNYTISMTFSEDVKLESGTILIKSGKNCTPYNLDITSNCHDNSLEISGHETAYAYGEQNATCFLNLGFNRWGWTNRIGEGSYEWPLYAGAGQCNLSKGTLVGSVSVVYSGGTLTATYNMATGFGLNTTTHLYVGATSVPNGSVAPGQYGAQGEFKTTYSISGLNGDIYVIAHAEVGSYQ